MKQKAHILLLVALFLGILAACSPEPTAQTPAVDESQLTPAAGRVSIIKSQAIKSVILRSAPDSKSENLGNILPGATGELLGTDPTGEWLLVRFDNQKGWIPIVVVELTFDN